MDSTPSRSVAHAVAPDETSEVQEIRLVLVGSRESPVETRPPGCVEKAGCVRSASSVVSNCALRADRGIRYANDALRGPLDQRPSRSPLKSKPPSTARCVAAKLRQIALCGRIRDCHPSQSCTSSASIPLSLSCPSGCSQQEMVHIEALVRNAGTQMPASAVPVSSQPEPSMWTFPVEPNPTAASR